MTKCDGRNVVRMIATDEIQIDEKNVRPTERTEKGSQCPSARVEEMSRSVSEDS